MASYRIEVDRRVRKKDLVGIPARDVQRILERIQSLAVNPYPADAVRQRGRTELRVRQGNYRILYTVSESTVTVFVVKVGHRREIYKQFSILL